MIEHNPEILFLIKKFSSEYYFHILNISILNNKMDNSLREKETK